MLRSATQTLFALGGNGIVFYTVGVWVFFSLLLLGPYSTGLQVKW